MASLLPPLSRIGKVVAVTSCKGGVGKSTVSFEVARLLASRGHRVAYYDADIHGPSLPALVPADVSARGVEPAADGWAMEPLDYENVAMMSFGWLGRLWSAGDGAVIDARGAGGDGALAVQLLHTTRWGDRDFLIIDTPPGTGDVPRALAARGALHGAVVVTTPSKLATVDVLRGVSMLRDFGVGVLGVVENMASFRCDGCEKDHFPFGSGHLDAILQAVGEKVPSVRLPIVDHAAAGADSRLADGLAAIADALENSAPGPRADLPKLDWHERPNWTGKLFFAGRGAVKRQAGDRAYKITPPAQ